MARTHEVKKSQKQHRCSACGQPIEVGQPYKWFKMKLSRGGIKKSYHETCTIPPSHRTTSRMGIIWDAQAAVDFSAAEDFDGIRQELETFAETVREVAEEYNESAQNIEDGFGHATYQSDELRERGEALESWADEIEQWDFSGEEPDEGDYETTDDEAYEAAVGEWQANEPQRDSFPEGEEGDEEHADAVNEWEGDEPTDSDFQMPDEDAFKAALDEVLEEARSEAQDAIDNCPV